MLEVNKIICGAMPEATKVFPDEFFNCCITSPPFWALRDYGIPPSIWDGDKDCEHKWGELFSGGEGYTNSVRWQHKKTRKTDPNSWDKNIKQGQFCSLCGAWRGCLGLEPTFELYIKHLCDIYDEVKRVLRKDGTCWVNLGDTYGGCGNKHTKGKEVCPSPGNASKTKGLEKSLCLIPQRFAIEMVNRGWILRNTIIWHKPNPMPSSAKDRFTGDFEYVFFFVKSNDSTHWIHNRKMLMVSQKPKPDYRWVHASGYELKRPPDEPNWKKKQVKCPDCKGTGKVRQVLNTLFFKGMVGAPEPCRRCLPSLEDPDVKNYTVPEWQRVNLWEGQDYWFEPQYEPYLTESNAERPRMGQGANTKYKQKRNYGSGGSSFLGHSGTLKADGTQIQNNPLGRNKRTVWTIPTQAYPEAHFATFPEKLVEPMILAGCPEFVCKKCGMGREIIYEPSEEYKKRLGKSYVDHNDDDIKGYKYRGDIAGRPCTADYRPKGYTDCGCNAGWRPGIVLDCFCGKLHNRQGGRKAAA